MSTTSENDDDKPNTRFISCKLGCGERFWGDRYGNCPKCKAALAKIARDQAVARRVAGPSPRLGAAYLRGLAMSKHLARG